MNEEGEGPAMTWVREYNAQLISLDDLAGRIARHKFRARKGQDSKPTLGRALDYKDANYEPGTFDDVYRARAYGLLTGQDMNVIMERVEEGKQALALEPDHVCPAAATPAEAALIELEPSPKPYLLKVGEAFVKVAVTG